MIFVLRKKERVIAAHSLYSFLIQIRKGDAYHVFFMRIQMQYGCDTISTTFCDKYSNRIFIQIAVYDRNCQRDRTTRND